MCKDNHDAYKNIDKIVKLKYNESKGISFFLCSFFKEVYMKQYVCEDVAMALGELEAKLKNLKKTMQSKEVQVGLDIALAALKETQEDWQSEELDLI